MQRDKVSALVGRSGDAVPLTNVSVSGEIACGHARIVSKQTYKNAGNKPIEAIYTFPLPAEGTLAGFRMTAAGRTVEGVVQEREAAFRTYDDAMSKGHGAALVEEERPNVFSANVGNILPGEEVTIELEYLQRLFAEEGAVRFMLPTLVAPRYIPGTPAGDRTAHGVVSPTTSVPDADRISPPRDATAPYRIALELTVDLGESVTLESPSHRIVVTTEGKKKKVSFEGEPLDRDFVLLCAQAEPGASVSAVCHREPGKEGHFALTVIPDLFEEQAKNEPLEVVFVLDRSGSMGGSSIQEARTALKLCLRQLREGDRFDVIAFDERIEQFAGKLVPFTQKSLAAVDKFLVDVDARGGTELLTPLTLASKMVGRGVIVLLTDGQVGNEDEIFRAVQATKSGARIHSFGIGTNVSTALLQNLAVASGGAVEMIYPGERIDEKVVAQFSRAIAKRIDEVTVKLEGLDVGELSPAEPRALVDGEPWTLFGTYEAAGVGRAIIRGKKDGSPFALEVPLWLEESASAPFVAKLWAKERVRELERTLVASDGSGVANGPALDGRRAAAMKQRIVEMCVAHGISSKYASFVVVEKRTGDRRTSEVAETKVVPVHLPAGWAMFDRNVDGATQTRAGALRMRGTAMPMAMAPPMVMRSPAPMASRPMAGAAAPTGAPPAATGAPPPPRSFGSLESPKQKKSEGFVQGLKLALGFGGGGGASDDDLEQSHAYADPTAPAPAATSDRSAKEASSAPPSPEQIFEQQSASGLFGDPRDVPRACEQTLRTLAGLFALGFDAAHSVYGAQIRKAVTALLAHVDALGDAELRARVLVVAWLVSGRRTRMQVEKEAARFGDSAHLLSPETARAFLAAAGV